MSKYECHLCDDKAYSDRNNLSAHWGRKPAGGNDLCTATNVYNEQGHSIHWQDFVDKAIKSEDEKQWAKEFGTGDGSIYFLTGKGGARDIRWIGKNEGGDVRQRVQGHNIPDDELPYLLCDGLSIKATRLLEKYLLQNWDLYNPNRRLRNKNYSYEERTPAGQDKKALRRRVVAMLARVCESIECGEQKPIEVGSKNRKRSSASPLNAVRQSTSAEFLSQLSNKSPADLERYRQKIEEEQAKRGTTTAESRKRSRPTDDGGGGTPKTRKKR